MIGFHELHLNKLLDGGVYTISEEKQVSSDGGEFILHVQNPPDSNTRFLVLDASAEMRGDGTLHLHDDFDSIAEGTAETVHSSRVGVTNNTPLEAYTGSTYTPASTHGYGLLGSGTGNSATVGDETASELLMAPDSNVVLHLTNNSTNQQTAVLNIIVAEIDGLSE